MRRNNSDVCSKKKRRPVWLKLGIKRIIRQEAVKWRPVKQGPTGKNPDFNFNALGGYWEKAQCIVVESGL